MIIQARSAVIDGVLREKMWLEISDGVISSINFGETPNPDRVVDGVLIPGFVDMHCHGGGGFYFSDPSLQQIEQAINTHYSHGTTALVASLVTAPLDVLKTQIQRLVPFAKSGKISGIHLEGPYLAPTRCGAHDPLLLRDPNVKEIEELLAIGNGHVRMVTIAPELNGAIDSIKYLVSQGVKVAIGHSAADFDLALRGVEAGANIVTHFPNAVSKLDDDGHTLADLALSDTRLFLEMILDGHHVSDETARRVCAVAHDRLVMVTDAMCAAGNSDGHYLIGQLPVTVTDSVARLDSNGALAGSTLTMDKSFFNMQSRLGYSIVQAVLATSKRPAQALSLNNRGEIAVGMKADLLDVDLQKERVSVIL
jgi:N-acetylglucosamine-6-phosphate deacetylase